MSALLTTSDVTVEHLRCCELRAVYPLMRQLDASLSLASWLRYGRRLTGSTAATRSGILVARRNALAHFSGAVCYRRIRHLNDGRMLVAEHFVAMDLLHPDRVLDTLAAALDMVAAAQGCVAIRSVVRIDDRGLLGALRQVGHTSEGLTLTKLVPSPDAAPGLRT